MRDKTGHTIFFLQKDGCSTALYNPIGHDGNPVSQNISFIHEVSCQQQGASCAELLQHSPNVTASVRIHSWGRLIQYDNLRFKKIKSQHQIVSTFNRRNFEIWIWHLEIQTHFQNTPYMILSINHSFPPCMTMTKGFYYWSVLTKRSLVFSNASTSTTHHVHGYLWISNQGNSHWQLSFHSSRKGFRSCMSLALKANCFQNTTDFIW